MVSARKFAPIMVCILASTVFAADVDTAPDTLEIAEAKQRGVPVEKVQIEHLKHETTTLRAKVAQLQSDNTSLTTRLAAISSQLETLKKSITPEQKVKLDQQATIAKAIADHKILEGMTVEQAGKAVSVKFHKTSASSDGEVWEGANAKQEPLRSIGNVTVGGQLKGIAYTLEVKDGIVTHWDSKPFSEDPGTARTVSP